MECCIRITPVLHCSMTPSLLLHIIHLHTSSWIFTTEAPAVAKAMAGQAEITEIVFFFCPIGLRFGEPTPWRGDDDRAKKAQPFGPFRTTLCFLIVEGQSLPSIDYLF